MKLKGGFIEYSSCNSNGGYLNDSSGLCHADTSKQWDNSSLLTASVFGSSTNTSQQSDTNCANCVKLSNFGGGAYISPKNKKLISNIFNKRKKNKKNNLRKLVNKEKKKS
jgi:hypothetical protein